MRKLASIQKISEIKPIDGADKIEVALMENLGWECVIAKKDNIKVGDLVIYIEIDSVMPECPEFEFLRERKFRVRTIKLRKQISQGLILPLTSLPRSVDITKIPMSIGDDVTDILNIKKYDLQIQEEQCLSQKKYKSKTLQFLMGFRIFRAIYLILNGKQKGNWPDWITKTDEERIQSCPSVLINNFDKNWYITEKLDGQSGSFFTYYKKCWGLKKIAFGVCSRNIWLKTPNNSNYWEVARKFDIENKLKKFNEEIVVQGEILATNVQKNKYKITEPDFYVFNVIKNGIRLSVKEMQEFCKNIELKTVPIIYDNYNPKNIYTDIELTPSTAVKKMVELSIAKSQLIDIQREGIVVRLIESPIISFKAINPEFLLKYDE